MSIREKVRTAVSKLFLGKKPLPKAYFIDNGKLQIINTNDLSVSFFWVVYSDASDPISQSAKISKIAIEHNIFELLKNLSVGTYLDLGGNIGAFSLPISALGWNGYIFEASIKNANLLQKSICINDFDITVINKAVYDKTGNIYFGQSGPYGLIQNEMTKGIPWEEIPCICLDDWCEQEEIPQKIDFIKMDIEGSEVAALRGMKKMLKKHGFPPIFVKSNSYTLFLQNETQKSLLSTAKGMGYIPFTLQNNCLYEYDINNYPILLVTDFLLLKEIPKNLMINKIEQYIQNPKKVVAYIIQSLQRVLEHNSYTDIPTCYVLKDFPEYVSNEEIKEKLEQIVKKNNQDKYLKKYLGWFIK
jgi:FkbM family methyltransferase